VRCCLERGDRRAFQLERQHRGDTPTETSIGKDLIYLNPKFTWNEGKMFKNISFLLIITIASGKRGLACKGVTDERFNYRGNSSDILRQRQVVNKDLFLFTYSTWLCDNPPLPCAEVLVSVVSTWTSTQVLHNKRLKPNIAYTYVLRRRQDNIEIKVHSLRFRKTAVNRYIWAVSVWRPGFPQWLTRCVNAPPAT